MPIVTIKKIFYFPKKPLLEIGPPSTIKPKIGYQTIKDSNVTITEKNKAKELILPGGSKITKEMLDKMDLSASSSDDNSSESTIDTENIADPAIKNIDMFVLQETQNIENKKGDDISSDQSDDNEMDLEDELMKQFNLETETNQPEEIANISREAIPSMNIQHKSEEITLEGQKLRELEVAQEIREQQYVEEIEKKEKVRIPQEGLKNFYKEASEQITETDKKQAIHQIVEKQTIQRTEALEQIQHSVTSNEIKKSDLFAKKPEKFQRLEIDQKIEQVEYVHEFVEKCQISDSYNRTDLNIDSSADLHSEKLKVPQVISQDYSREPQTDSSSVQVVIEEDIVFDKIEKEQTLPSELHISSKGNSNNLNIKSFKKMPLAQESEPKVTLKSSRSLASEEIEQFDTIKTNITEPHADIQIKSSSDISTNEKNTFSSETNIVKDNIHPSKNSLFIENIPEAKSDRAQTVPSREKVSTITAKDKKKISYIPFSNLDQASSQTYISPSEKDLVSSLGKMKISEQSVNQKEDTSGKIPIGSGSSKNEPQIYQFAAQSIDSLPSKLFLERIRAEFHCCFVSRQSEGVILNDLFKKGYTRRFLDVIDDELRQSDLNPTFAKSLRELKQNVQQKAVPKKEHAVSYTINQILSMKERTPIPLNVDKKIFSSHLRRDKKEDVISQFRFELNRIAWTNANFVIERIKKLKILKDSEMIQLSKIIFQKAISEDAFCKLYAHVVHTLYKIFKSEEEKKRHESQTVFFSEIIRLIQDIFKKKEKWASQLDLSSYTVQERFSMQDTIDDENIIKETKKGRMLGTVKFVSYLYSNSVIGFKGVSFCFNSLMDFNDEENVETLSLLLMNCGEKIVESDKSSELTRIVNEMRKPWDWSLRIKFLTQDVIQKCEDWLKTKKKKSPFKNAFSALQQNLNKPIKDSTLSKKSEPPKGIEPQKKDIQQSVISEHPNGSDYDDEIFSAIDKISRIVEDIPQVVDFTPLVDEINQKMTEMDIDMLYKALFLIILEHYNTFSDDLKFLKFLLETHSKKPNHIINILDDIQKRLPGIAVDCPFVQKNYNLLVYCLNIWLKCNYDFRGFDKKTSQQKFEDLKLNE